MKESSRDYELVVVRSSGVFVGSVAQKRNSPFFA